MYHEIVLNDMNEYNRILNNYMSGVTGTKGHFKIDDLVEICCGVARCMFLVVSVVPYNDNLDIIMLAKSIKCGVYEELN